jgi:WD40 repeat protein
MNVHCKLTDLRHDDNDNDNDDYDNAPIYQYMSCVLCSASDNSGLPHDLLQVVEGHSDEVLQLSFSPSGRLLASGGKDKNVEWHT